MTNVVATARCDSGCPFCFAARLAGWEPELRMDQWLAILDAIPAGGEVRLVGGEPTLHPRFRDLVASALERGLEVTVLTGGPATEDAERVLRELPEGRPSVILNLNAAVRRRGADAVRRWARLLGPRLVPGITVDRPGPEITALVAVVEDAPTSGVLRVGQAHPVLGGGTRAASPREYPAIGRIITDLARRVARHGMTVALDCGFVRCQFRPEDLEWLGGHGAEIRFECRPIVDVMPDGSALHCLALGARFRQPRPAPAAEHRRQMARARRPLESFGVYRECSRCSARARGACDGGCLVHRLHRLAPAPEPATLLGGPP